MQIWQVGEFLSSVPFELSFRLPVFRGLFKVGAKTAVGFVGGVRCTGDLPYLPGTSVDNFSAYYFFICYFSSSFDSLQYITRCFGTFFTHSRNGDSDNYLPFGVLGIFGLSPLPCLVAKYPFPVLVMSLSLFLGPLGHYPQAPRHAILS